MSYKKAQLATFIGAAMLAATAAPVAIADGHNPNRTVIYVTRHAEKQTVELEDGTDNCAPDSKGKIRCEEELSALGELRADLLAEYLEDRGVVRQLTHVISSDKQRTRQTIEPTAAKVLDLGTVLFDGEDGINDGVAQIPAFDANSADNELTSNGKSVDPMAQAILDLPAGSVALVAAHSGTIYKIFGGDDTDGNPNTGDDDSVGLGIDTTIGNNFDDVTLFPKKESDGKVRDFGDLWKIVINNRTGDAQVVWRKSLQPLRLQVENQTTNRNGRLQNRFW